MTVLTKRRNGIRKPFRSIVSDLFDNDEFFYPESFNNPSLPAVNVRENKNSFEIELAAPGMRKKDFNIKIDNGVLNVSSEKEETSEEINENYTRKEFNYSSFGRSFTLPESINSEKIKAKYTDGVLCIQLDKKEESKKLESKIIHID